MYIRVMWSLFFYLKMYSIYQIKTGLTLTFFDKHVLQLSPLNWNHFVIPGMPSEAVNTWSLYYNFVLLYKVTGVSLTLIMCFFERFKPQDIYAGGEIASHLLNQTDKKYVFVAWNVHVDIIQYRNVVAGGILSAKSARKGLFRENADVNVNHA